MRFNIRIVIRNITFFMMLSQTQTMIGLTSLIKNVKNVRKNIHIVLWDLEGATLEQVIKELRRVQLQYNLGKIYIVGDDDKGKSFRAWCFTRLKFREYIQVLLDTEYLDYLFFKYTIIRGKATLRLSKKKGRGEQEIVAIIDGKDNPIPKVMEKVIYDTGLIKSGKTFEWVKE